MGSPGLWENWTVLFTGSVGITDAYWVCNPGLFTNSTGFPDFPRPVDSSLVPEDIQTCPMSQPVTLAKFWAIDMAMGIVCILIELVLLGMVAVRCSCMIASEYSFRLVPLNAERAFVSNALIRACFEMGNPKSPVLGVDPDAGPETTVQRRLKIAAMAGIYGGKIVLTGGEHPAWFPQDSNGRTCHRSSLCILTFHSMHCSDDQADFQAHLSNPRVDMGISICSADVVVLLGHDHLRW